MAQTAYLITVPASLHAQPPANGNGHRPDEEFIDFEPLPEIAPLAQSNPIDWDGARAEVVRLIDEAHVNAQALIAEGQQRAIELISEAAAHAGDLEEDARNGGFEQGRQDGRNAADAELDDMLTTMRGLVDVARAERHKIIEGAEPEIIKLAMTLAEKVVHQQITIDGSVVLSMARAAISRLVTRETVTVRVNPADIETIRENKAKMLASTDIEHLRIVEDLRVDRGGIVMETESGTIDAKVSTQLKEAKRVLQVEDDPTPVAPSDDDTLIATAMRAS